MYELFFDAVIALVIGAVPVWFALARQGTASGKGQSLVIKRKGWGPLHFAAALVWFVVFYGSFIEPRFLVVKDYTVNLRFAGAEGPGRSLDLAVVSDLHLGKYRHFEWARQIVDRVNALHPDAVLLAGDLATTLSGTAAFPPLRDLKSRFGTYAVLGNWDYHAGAVDVRKSLGSYGVKTLVNRSISFEKDGATFCLIGLDDFEYGNPDWDAAVKDVEPGAIPILLVHDPDAVSQAEVRGMPLLIAGHTHGGQIRLPFIGPVPRLPTKLGNGYDRGGFLVGSVNLFISPGAGESGPRARLLQPPEISFLHVIY